MAWILGHRLADDAATRATEYTQVVTGKPLEAGGSAGRDKSESYLSPIKEENESWWQDAAFATN